MTDAPVLRYSLLEPLLLIPDFSFLSEDWKMSFYFFMPKVLRANELTTRFMVNLYHVYHFSVIGRGLAVSLKWHSVVA
jgi:hypothetical protein